MPFKTDLANAIIARIADQVTALSEVVRLSAPEDFDFVFQLPAAGVLTGDDVVDRSQDTPPGIDLVRYDVTVIVGAYSYAGDQRVGGADGLDDLTEKIADALTAQELSGVVTDLIEYNRTVTIDIDETRVVQAMEFTVPAQVEWEGAP
jgi:hypothetical protein